MQNQKFKIFPGGIVDGGTASYSFNPQTGGLTYAYDLSYRLFGSRHLGGGETIKVNPADFRSVLAKPGATFNFGLLTVTVLTVGHGQATCSVEAKVGPVTEKGTAVLDISGEFVKILRVVADGKYMFQDIALHLESI